ncbi:hypothetical protein LTR37_008814 [Vermiconidia calcicola]|uniref:Uncharacterized protein n=1 Tax=Vermiconidia calcicola TaxID=1690605 RepID=A0ACC3NAS9_9PEZI|nr:hypothetical protein LTR37_008814 [Vermiconidia calcicola]
MLKSVLSLWLLTLGSMVLAQFSEELFTDLENIGPTTGNPTNKAGPNIVSTSKSTSKSAPKSTSSNTIRRTKAASAETGTTASTATATTPSTAITTSTTSLPRALEAPSATPSVSAFADSGDSDQSGEDVGTIAATTSGARPNETANTAAANDLSESTAEPELAAASSGGLSSTQKTGIGIGVGLGIPIILGAIALIFFLRRRRSNQRYSSSGSSAAHLRDQPAMSSAAPALAGVSAMGTSPSRHSLPQTPSQHSLAEMSRQPSDLKTVPPSQQPLSRDPSQRSMAVSLPEQENLMPAPPAYEDAPSPLEEHNAEPPSPVSPISPMNSRPPSPMNGYGHQR